MAGKRSLARVIRACAWIASGVALNYLLEHHSFGNWADALLPTLVVVFVTIGVVLTICEVAGSERNCLVPSVATSVFLGLSYAAITLGYQTIEKGGSLIQDCSGLISAAGSSGDVPQSSLFPSDPAADCMAARIGVLLEPYTYLDLYGVTSRSAQDRILSNVSMYRDEPAPSAGAGEIL